MSKNAYIGSGGKARKIKNLYVGVNGKARKVKKAYIGVNGKARLFFSAVVEESATDMTLDVAFAYDIDDDGWDCAVVCPNGKTLTDRGSKSGVTVTFKVRQYGTYQITAINSSGDFVAEASVEFVKGGGTTKYVWLDAY